jgi:hypothetical protein
MTAAVPAIPTWVRRLGGATGAVARGLLCWLMEYIVKQGRMVVVVNKKKKGLMGEDHEKAYYVIR